MLLSSNDITRITLKTDYCIIGSGIGASTLAYRLADQKKRFIIIEAGGINSTDRLVLPYENTGREFGLRRTHEHRIGGTSNLWHGVLAPLDLEDFQSHPWIPHSGWPIDYQDLYPYYQLASKLLGLENFNFFNLSNLPPALKAQLGKLPIDYNPLISKIFQQPLPPTRFIKKIIDITRKANDRHCIYHCVALELQSQNQNNEVTRLKVGLQDGKTSYVYAKKFIICAGAIQTPRLLLNSTNSINCLKSNCNIGRFLLDHPMGNLCQVKFKYPQKYPIFSDIKYEKKIKIKAGLCLNFSERKKLKLANHCFFLRPSFVEGISNKTEKLKLDLLVLKSGDITVKKLWDILRNINTIKQIVSYKMSLNTTFKYADLFFVTEQLPNPQSKITLSFQKDSWGYPISKINWQLTSQDFTSMSTWFDLLQSKIFPVTHFNFTHTKKDVNWLETSSSAAHHCGTARMAESLQSGVVDNNLKVFSIANLYICDASVLPTIGNANCGLTIAALSCRLADQLSRSRIQ